MFELYGVSRDGMVYHSPPPRRKEVDILEVYIDDIYFINLSIVVRM